MAERLHIGGAAARHVQAYLEYEQIVGNDDGGKMMSEAEFEEYKARVRAKRANRLYVNWRNMETGTDCKAIGPASQCFCGHRYKDHNFDNVDDKKVNCKDKQCKCRLFNYIPVFGSQDFKCQCKHSCHEHQPVSHKCTRPKCQCASFNSTHSCSCGSGYNVHETVLETRAEREAEGRQVDAAWLQESNMVGGMGGLGHQDFSSLADDQDRRDMMNPGAIMSNMMGAGQIMGSNMQKAIGAGPGAGRGQQKAIGSSGGGAGNQQMVAAQRSSSGAPSLLELFNTPHSYGGVGGITNQMRQLQM